MMGFKLTPAGCKRSQVKNVNRFLFLNPFFFISQWQIIHVHSLPALMFWGRYVIRAINVNTCSGQSTTCKTYVGKTPLTCCLWYLRIVGDFPSHTVLIQKEWTAPGMNRSEISLYLSVPHIPQITSTDSQIVYFIPVHWLFTVIVWNREPVDCSLNKQLVWSLVLTFFSLQVLILDRDHSTP